MKVVDNMVVAGRAGIEFLDTDTGEVAAHHWMRGSCYYGVLPANGRLYLPPHDCACYVRAKLAGFFALNSNRRRARCRVPDEDRLQRGPAYGKVPEDDSDAQAENWPTYRHDAARSGRTKPKIGSELLLGWQATTGRQTYQSCGCRQSGVCGFDGRAHAACRRRHDRQARSGRRLSTAASILHPPYTKGWSCGVPRRFGPCAASHRRSAGVAFHRRPGATVIVSHGQLESVWPVSGSVLVVNNIVYFAAGRSSYLDGGIRLYGLDAHTGASSCRQRAFDASTRTVRS